MTFTKKKLAAAIGGTLLASVGVVQTTQAAVEIDGTGTNALSYASEIVIAGTGQTLADAAGAQDVLGTMNTNAILDLTSIRTTLTLSSGTFAAVPTVTIVGTDGASDVACPTDGATGGACAVPTIFDGGTTADSSVTYNTATNGNTVVAGAQLLWDVNGINVTDQSAVTATISSQIADLFGTTDLDDNSAGYLSFSTVLALTADLSGADNAADGSIDVAQNSLFFSQATGTSAVNVGGAIIVSTAGPDKIDTTDLVIGDVLGNVQTTITAASGFAAFNQGTVGGSVEVNSVTAPVSTADATIAVAPAIAGATGAAGSADVILTIPAANTVAIDETSLTATVAGTAASTSYNTSSSTGTVSLASLARNGSSARLTFSVNPDSPYPMSIRVTNDSAVGGPVTLTLTNDDGETSAAVSLSDITGVAGDLAAGSSTALIQMADVFAAVQAADATFELGASSNKLRVGISSLTPSIVLNAFSLSSDGTTFSMVTDAGA